MKVIYNHEYPHKLKACFIGCGGHSFRNIYPAFAYLPIDLLAVCDLELDKAKSVARQFGALNAYHHHIEMLEKEKPDVVFIVTGYDKQGRCRYPALACDAMKRGADVWVEKPPLNDLADVDLLRKTMADTGKKFAVGFKKMFFPANVKLKEISLLPEFGKLSSIALRYPQQIPTVEQLTYQGDDWKIRGARIGFLDHLCHPVSLLQCLGGRTKSLSYTRVENGSGFALFSMVSGAEACIHFASQSAASPLERTEITGERTNAIVENNIRLTWYRPVNDPDFRRYGSQSTFTGSIQDAPVIWEPEFSLGNLYNKNIFLLGYWQELKYFCDAALNNTAIEIGSIDDAEEGIRIFDAFKRGPGTVVTIGSKT